MKWKSLILDNLEGHWQPVQSAILAMGFFHQLLHRPIV